MFPAYPASKNKQKMASTMVGTNQSKTVTYQSFDICLRKKLVDGKPTLCGTLNGGYQFINDNMPVEYTNMENFRKAVSDAIDSKIKEME